MSAALSNEDKVINSSLNGGISALRSHEERKNRAAILLQSVWRGRAVRAQAKESHGCLLSYALFNRAKAYIDVPSSLSALPKASFGRTPVYIPKYLPIVIKKSGDPDNQERFKKIQEAKFLCDTAGFENLVIPRARIYKNFLVESKLPITQGDPKLWTGFYIENLKQFDQAIVEFTNFLYLGSLYDITDLRHDYVDLVDVEVGRYDNVGIYLDGDQGKIGLFDLEHFSLRQGKVEQSGFHECLKAIRFFPYHFDLIISFAREWDPEIIKYQSVLEAERDEVLKFIKCIYLDHLTYVKEKGITVNNPMVMPKLSSSRIQEIKDVVNQVLIEEHKGNKEHLNRFKGCLGNNPEETLSKFNQNSFEKILGHLFELIENVLKFNMEEYPNRETVPSCRDLLYLRTLFFSESHSVYDEKFLRSTANLLGMMSYKAHYNPRNILAVLVEWILKELERGKEIALYNPSYGKGGGKLHCVFI